MVITNTHVYFWGGPFSNFYKTEIKFKGMNFHSSEQLFMYLKAVKFGDTKIAEEILKCKTPKSSKNLGRSVKNFNSEEWYKYKVEAMMIALKSKFYKNLDLMSLLMRNKHKIFVEASPYDRIWGVGLSEDDPEILNESNWMGENLLGKCLNRLIKEFGIYGKK